MEASVIIPAYNEEDYIARTLEALPEDVETIVVANGCTDSTADIAKRYAQVVVTKKRGVSRARNLGAIEASTGFLIFLDADIVVEKDTLKKILESKFDIGICKAKPDMDKLLPKFLMFLKNRFNWIGYSTGLIFCTREVFDSLKGFDESLDKGEDGKFIRAAKKMFKFGVVNTYVLNSMRRFEKQGYSNVIWFWIREFFRKSKESYKAIR
ncbi:MAG: glycosyltransferase [Candidatus Woesearchaeota archaeon]